MTREQRLKQTIWETVMEGTAHCGWTDRARESLVKSVQDAVLWADHAAPAGDDGELRVSDVLSDADIDVKVENYWNDPRKCFKLGADYQKSLHRLNGTIETQLERAARAHAPRSQGGEQLENLQDFARCCFLTLKSNGRITREDWDGHIAGCNCQGLVDAFEQLTKTPDSVTSDPPSNVGESQGAEFVEQIKLLREDARHYLQIILNGREPTGPYSLGRHDTYKWVLEKIDEALASRPKAEGREFELIFDDDSDNPEVRVVSTTVFIKPNEVIHVREVGDV